ncbi:MAG: xanthine dehydrogenase family protein subunit M [Gaiellaceae bacterium MAG52_C11]|nr:xanthine dehydrogenase family protein subunit M [Candidatus Gaiellasilicea maunaloa]
MIPAAFDYEVAESVEHAIELLGSTEDPKLLAGGHSLLPFMKFRLARPATLIDIGRISGLSGVSDGGEHLAIGALTRHHDLNHDPLVKEHCPLLAYAAGLVGDSQVRHRGTIGGSLAHGDSAADLPTIALTLDAEIVVRGPDRERTIAATDFFRGFYETALEPNEAIVEVRVPKTGAAGWSYIKFRRRALDWATVGIATVVEAGNGTIESARIGLTNMGQTPLRAAATEQALAGAARDRVAEATARADEGTEPPSDVSASSDFRRHLCRVLTARAVEEALSR